MVDSANSWKSFLVLGLCGILLGFSYLLAPADIFTAALIACAIFIIAFIRPEYGFYLILFFLAEELVHYFIRIPPWYMVRIYPYEPILVVTAVSLILAKISTKETLKKTPITALLWIIVITEIISCIWAPNTTMAFWLALILLLNLTLYYITINIIVSDNILKTSIKVWIAAGIVAAGGVIASQWIDFTETTYLTANSGLTLAFQEVADRPSGFGGSNHIGAFISTAFFMTLGTMMYEKKWKAKIGYLLIMTFLLIGVIVTASRGVFVGLIGAFLFFISIHGRFKNKFIKYSVIMIICTVLLVLITKPAFIDRILIGFGYTGYLAISDTTYTGAEANTAEGQGISGMEMRMIWWKNALHEMVIHPLKMLFGLGLGGFYYYSSGTNTVTSPEVNSLSFSFFYDLGILGIILFILLFIVVAQNLYYYLKNAKQSYCYYMLLAATSAMIAETVIHGLVDFDLASYGSKFFWFPLGFTMAVLNIVKSENIQLEQDKNI